MNLTEYPRCLVGKKIRLILNHEHAVSGVLESTDATESLHYQHHKWLVRTEDGGIYVVTPSAIQAVYIGEQRRQATGPQVDESRCIQWEPPGIYDDNEGAYPV